MKKKIFLALVIMTVSTIFLTGCNSQNKTSDNYDQKNQQQTRDIQKSNSQNQEQASNKNKRSLAELIKKGQAQKCTWEVNTQSVESSGEVYIDTQGRTYSETKMSENSNQKMTVYSINDGDYIYTWNDQSQTGNKMKYSELEDQTAKQNKDQERRRDRDSEENNYQKRLNKEYSYQCQNWKANQNKFQPPEEINFIDSTEQLQKMQKGMKNMEENVCQMCQNLSGQAKESCLQGCE